MGNGGSMTHSDPNARIEWLIRSKTKDQHLRQASGLGVLIVFLGGCFGGMPEARRPALLASPEGTQVVDCSAYATQPYALGMTPYQARIAAERTRECIDRLRSIGWIEVGPEWQAHVEEMKAKAEAIRNYWEQVLRPAVEAGQMKAKDAVERLNGRERETFGMTIWRERVHALRRSLAEEVDAGAITLTQAERYEVEFRATGRVPPLPEVPQAPGARF